MIEAPPVDETAEADDLPGCQPPLWLVLVGLVALIGACAFGLQLFSVIYGLIFPPSAPRPDGLTEINHESVGIGAAQWLYDTSLTPCEVVAFYEDAGCAFTYVDGGCAGGVYAPSVFEADYFATCEYVEPFSIFAFRWRVTIEPNYNPNPTRSRFLLFSEVLWGGPPPDN